MDTSKLETSKYLNAIEQDVRKCEALRMDAQKPMDVSLADFVKLAHGCSMEDYYTDLGIDPSYDTIQNLYTTPNTNYKWIIPEIIRESLRLGLRQAPIYPSVIAAEQSVNGLSVTMPWINMSDATMRYVEEAETIGLGTVSFSQKTMKLRKMGRGIKIPYEVKNYVAINVVAIFLQDMGIKLGHGLDGLLIDTLLNGEQADGSESAPTVGVGNTTTGITYRDILRVWIRMARMGKRPTVMIGGEDIALDILDLDEFKLRDYGTTQASLNIKTPIPNRADFFIHGAMPANTVLIIDPNSTVIKYNAQPLLVESEKIVSNQTEATYASLTTGFGILYRDSRVAIDDSLAFSGNGFPSYFNVDAQQDVNIGE